MGGEIKMGKKENLQVDVERERECRVRKKKRKKKRERDLLEGPQPLFFFPFFLLLSARFRLECCLEASSLWELDVALFSSSDERGADAAAAAASKARRHCQ